LTGLALCGVCGSTIHGGGSTTRGVRTYRCRASYGHVGRRAEPVDRFVSSVVIERLSRPDAADLLVDHAKPDVDALRERAVTLRERLTTLAVEFADGSLTAGQIKTATESIRAQLAATEAEMADAGRVDLLGPLVRAEDVEAVWRGLDTSRRRAVIDALTEAVRVMPAGRGRRDFDPDTVTIDWLVDRG
jgi:hypothetical protein